MDKLSINELVALQFILKFISVKELIQACMNWYSEQDSVKAKDNSDICYKALYSFLTQ